MRENTGRSFPGLMSGSPSLLLPMPERPPADFMLRQAGHADEPWQLFRILTKKKSGIWQC